MIRNDEYENRLRKILLHSADVLPEKVTAYLKGVPERKDPDATKEILKTYRILVDYIPKEFTDFVTDVLIRRPRCPITPDSDLEFAIYLAKSHSPRPDPSFGIRDKWDYELFDPPAYIQGPFLYFLTKDEDEGLRLIQTLTKAATDRWCEQAQRRNSDEHPLTLLPVRLNLTFGSHDFWGDVQVYCWYRGTTYNGPKVVISALMALEVWMEKQIEAGRNVEALFEKILRGTNSVAVLGVCLSITLAHPQKCLKAALPIVSSPAIWRMDIKRLVGDMSGRFKLPFERKDWIYKLLEEHDKKPHRKLEIRSLATYYLFFSDDPLCVLFEEAVAQFTKKLPFEYREEQEDPIAVSTIQKQMEIYQVFGKRENYHFLKDGDNLYVKIEPPENIKKRNEEELAFNSEYQRWLEIELWSCKAMEKNELQEIMNLEEMVRSAKELQQPNDFVSKELENHYDNTRLGAISGVAAAILVVDFEWVKAQNLLQWSRDVLMAATHAVQPSIYATPLCKFDVSAGRGLALLAAHGVADAEVRQEIFLLISKSLRRVEHDQEVVKAVFIGLQGAWNADPVLCWNTLSLCLSLSVIPGKLYYGTRLGEVRTSFEELETWKDNVIQNHFDSLAKDEIPVLPRISTARNIVFVHEQAKYGLYALPLIELCREPATKDKLLQLCNDLIARTIADNLPVEGKPYSQSHKPYMWNPFIFNWAACLSKSLGTKEIRQHILTPLRDNWLQIPELTAALLDGYISHQIAYVEEPTAQALETWKEVCNWVLDSPEIARKASYDYLDRDTGEVLQLIVFTQQGSSRIEDDWQHAHLFIDIFDKWVSIAGHNLYAYSHLLTMLNGIGWQFAPEPTLEWLSRCTSNAVYDLWNEERKNGRRTAELLNRIWNSFERQIRSDSVLLRQYSNLVYRLVEAGIPLASVLQQKLEGRE